MVWNSEISGKKRLNRDNLYQQWDKFWKKEIKYFLSTGWKMSKIKTRNLHRYCSLSCSPSLSLSLSDASFYYLWDWKQERQLVSEWVSCRFVINFITIVVLFTFVECLTRGVSENYVIVCSCNWLDVLSCKF